MPLYNQYKPVYYSQYFIVKNYLLKKILLKGLLLLVSELRNPVTFELLHIYFKINTFDKSALQQVLMDIQLLNQTLLRPASHTCHNNSAMMSFRLNMCITTYNKRVIFSTSINNRRLPKLLNIS